MKHLGLAVLALAITACADGPSPRQKYGASADMVTGSNVLKKDPDQALEGVKVYSSDALDVAQMKGAGGTTGRDPNGVR